MRISSLNETFEDTQQVLTRYSSDPEAAKSFLCIFSMAGAFLCAGWHLATALKVTRLVDPQHPLIQLAPCHNKPMLRQFTSNLLLLMKWFALFVAWASIILRFGGVGGR